MRTVQQFFSRLRPSAGLLLAAALTACSNGGGLMPSAGSGTHAADLARRGKGRLVLRVHVPKRRQRHVHARYISAATKSVAIDLTGPTTLNATFNLTPSSKGCASGNGGTTCTLTLALAAGAYTGAISTYDGANGTGHELSAVQDVGFTIVAAHTNSIGVTLDGIPTSVALDPDGSSSLAGTSSSGFTLSKCTTAAQKVSVLGVDADGNYILDAGAPASPSLASNDTTHLAIATPSPSSSEFALVPPSSLSASTIPAANQVVEVTAKIVPGSNSGHTQVSSVVKVTFNSDVCGVITEYSVPSADSHPSYIAAGSDGNLWFTEYVANKIGKITTGGTISEYSLPAGSSPEGITAGPDGNLWFAECTGNEIGKMTTGGVTDAQLPVPTSGSVPSGITAGPDDNLWFTEYTGNKIGKVTTVGTIDEYSIPTSGAQPEGIAPGPDGNLWFAESAGNKIGKITTGGTIAEYSIPTNASAPANIAEGPDGNLWFTEYTGNKIGKITTGGTIAEYSIPTNSSAARHRRGPGRQPVVRGIHRQQDREDHHRRQDHRVLDPDKR